MTDPMNMYSILAIGLAAVTRALLGAQTRNALGTPLPGITPVEFERARHQLRARLVFEADSVTSIAHQIGYFHTIADVDVYHGMEAALAEVTLEDVARVARQYLAPSSRTVGWFEPIAEHSADMGTA